MTRNDELTLKDLGVLLDSVSNVMELGKNDQMKIMGYMERVDEAGTGILKDIIRDDNDMANVMTIFASLITVGLLSSGNTKEAFMLLGSPSQFQGILTLALKMSVGLATIEEWR